MSAVVEYENGARMSYSLHAFTPWEGYTVVFNGSRGRLEHKCEESVYLSGDGSVPGALRADGTWIRVFPQFEPAYEVPIEETEGGHGGGDQRLVDDLFGPPSHDPLGLRADHRAGAWSILTGIAANRSIDGGAPVRVRDLITGLD
jgi:hypothetical protein